jgi:type IX secretion system PorP/SprF family membrane protein
MRLIPKTHVLFTILALGAMTVHAQQEPQFTQYMFYAMGFNPGVAGSENAICITGADRMQWVGFEDADGNKVAPETFFITVGAPVRALRGGLSASVMQDKIGFEKTIAFKVGYAYQKAIGFGKLGIGTHIEFNNRSVDFSKFDPAEENDPLLSLKSNESDMLIDFSLGLFYRVPDSYYIGISGLHLIGTRGAAITSSNGSELRMKLDRTFMLTGGFVIGFNRYPDFQLLPSALIKTNLSTFQVDLTTLLMFKETVWGGLSYRYQDAVAVLLGLQFKDISLGYSYDINTSRLKLPFGGGTHEIMLNYCFKLDMEKGRKSYKNTRFL